MQLQESCLLEAYARYKTFGIHACSLDQLNLQCHQPNRTSIYRVYYISSPFAFRIIASFACRIIAFLHLSYHSPPLIYSYSQHVHASSDSFLYQDINSSLPLAQKGGRWAYTYSNHSLTFLAILFSSPCLYIDTLHKNIRNA